MRALIGGAVAALLACTGAMAQTAPRVTSLGPTPPTSFLYVGNSFYYYNNGITGHIAGLAQGAGAGAPAHRATMATIGGSGFDWHDVESYFRPDAVGSYTFDAQNRIVFNKDPQKYQAAVLMDCSQCPIHPVLAPVFVRYAKLHADTVRRHGAVPILFMSWAYADHPEMTAQLAEAYTRAGNDNGALVIPAGLAFARVLKARPELKLHVADNRHPTLAGTYLAAAASYVALFGRPIDDNAYTAGLDPELARFLRTEAAAAVRDYVAGAVVN